MTFTMTAYRGVLAGGGLVILFSVTAAGSAWLDAWQLRDATRAIGAEIERTAGEIARLQRLPPAPPLAPVQGTLSRFLGTVPAPWIAQFGEVEPLPSLGRGPNQEAAPGIKQVRLILLYPVVPPKGPEVPMAELERWQTEWPLDLTQVGWTGKAVQATLILYGS